MVFALGFMKKALPYILVPLLIFGGGYYLGIQKANKQIAAYEESVNSMNTEVKEKQTTVVIPKVEVQYQDRIKTVNTIEYVNREVIKEIPAQCNVTKGWVYSHNQAAQGLEIDPELSKDPTPADTTDITILDTLIQNYSIDRKKDARIKEWQDWYVLTKENLESVRKD